MPSLRLALLSSIAALALGCAHGVASDDLASESSEAQIAESVVVADPSATSIAVVDETSVRIPVAAAARYRLMPPGTIFVGARGEANGTNPDGFLRRVESVTEDGGMLVVNTSPATLTDAVVRGALRASNGGKTFEDASEQSLRPLTARKDLNTVEIDFSDESLFEGVDEIGGTRFTESIRLDRAVLSAHPIASVDLAIRDGKVSRFVAKVEGNLDSTVQAVATVTADGEASAETLSALKAKKHDVTKKIFASKRIPLPTISIGRVPVSPSVQLSVVLRCTLAFGGPIHANAGVVAKSYVRLGAVYSNGGWGEPIKSDFTIHPSFAMDKGGEIDARCALEARAELFAYGVSGVTMSVAPYVQFAAQGAGPQGFKWRAEAGATGAMHGRAGVFGVKTDDLERPLAEWRSDAPLEGASP